MVKLADMKVRKMVDLLELYFYLVATFNSNS